METQIKEIEIFFKGDRKPFRGKFTTYTPWSFGANMDFLCINLVPELASTSTNTLYINVTEIESIQEVWRKAEED